LDRAGADNKTPISFFILRHLLWINCQIYLGRQILVTQ
jgi:hypothetical protein